MKEDEEGKEEVGRMRREERYECGMVKGNGREMMKEGEDKYNEGGRREERKRR